MLALGFLRGFGAFRAAGVSAQDLSQPYDAQTVAQITAAIAREGKMLTLNVWADAGKDPHGFYAERFLFNAQQFLAFRTGTAGSRHKPESVSGGVNVHQLVQRLSRGLPAAPVVLALARLARDGQNAHPSIHMAATLTEGPW